MELLIIFQLKISKNYLYKKILNPYALKKKAIKKDIK